MNFYRLKETAKERLSGKYKDAIIILILYAIISTVGAPLYKGDTFTLKSVIGILINTVCTSFFIMGYNSFYLKLSRKKDPKYNELFSKIGMFKTAFVISFVTTILVLVGLTLLIIPGIIVMIMYSQACFIALDNESLSPIDCLKASRKMMDGHKMEYFKFVLPYYLLMILSAFLLFIPLLYLIPNLCVALALYYDEIKGK